MMFSDDGRTSISRRALLALVRRYLGLSMRPQIKAARSHARMGA